MKSRVVAINLDDSFDLVAVWQREGRKWQLLKLERPGQAILLYQKEPKIRLIFPVGINPNYLKKESRRRHNKLVNLVIA